MKGITKMDITHSEKHLDPKSGSLMRQIILGGQDGLVNVLGLVLGVAGATADTRLIIIAGLAATAAESISMTAVAYTSSKAEKENYYTELENEKYEMEHLPEVEREEIKLIYMKKGFRGKALDEAVNRICANKKIWLDTMMDEELGLKNGAKINPFSEALVVGASSVIGSIIPIVPFLILQTQHAIIGSLILSILTLFGAGAYKGKITIGNWVMSGIEMAAIGFGAAMVGYWIGYFLGVSI